MYECPKCKSNKMNIERCLDGKVECSDCGFVLREHGTMAVPNEYIPEQVTILKDNINIESEPKGEVS